MIILTDRELERFWSKVDKNGPLPEHLSELGQCWVWTGSLTCGYGQFYFRGKPARSSRISWIIENGFVTDDLHVLHHCDVPRCVRPSHLFQGTNKDNIHDRMTKGRGYRKLNPVVVQEILNLKGIYGSTQVASDYGVDPSLVCRLWLRYGDPNIELGKPINDKRSSRPIRFCSIDGCDRKHKKHGYCVAHAKRVKTYGDPMAHIPVGQKPHFFEKMIGDEAEELAGDSVYPEDLEELITA